VKASCSCPAAETTNEKETLRSPRDRTVQPVDYTNELDTHTSDFARVFSYLRDEGDQLPKMRGLFGRTNLKYLTRGVVVIPLL